MRQARPGPAACWLALCWLLSMTAGCQQPPPAAKASWYVLGTTVSLQLKGLAQSEASDILLQSQTLLQALHRDWHAWEPGQLDQLNAAIADGGCHTINEPLRRVLKFAALAEQQSDGAFNAGIGALVRAWGFHTSEYPLTSPPPDAASIAALLRSRPSLQQLNLDQTCVSASNPQLRIDLGAIGKGAAVDELVGLLKSEGVSSALVNAGGDLRGFSSVGHQWRIAVRNPHASGAVAILPLGSDESVFTSGGYTRYGESAGERYAHIINPHTGLPAEGIASATVVADSGAKADAGATALVVSDLKQAPDLARAMGLKHLLLIDEEGCLWLDQGLLGRLTFPSAAAGCVNILDFNPAL